MGRAPCCDKVGLKKGPWTPEEDQILIDFIAKHGHSNWRALPKQSGLLRCGKSCRLRWINYLKPDIKRGNFTREEEDTIIHLHEVMGNRWSAIAARLPGRTDNEIKNVWHTHLKKRLKDYQKTTKSQTKKIATSSSRKSRDTTNNNVTTTPTTITDNNSTSTGNSFLETTTSFGTSVQNQHVTSSGSPQQSSTTTTEEFSSGTEVSSVELPNNIGAIMDVQSFNNLNQETSLEDFPIIDESFWEESQELLLDHGNFYYNNNNTTSTTSEDFSNIIIDDNGLQFETLLRDQEITSIINNNNDNNVEGIYFDDDDNMDFWLDVFVQAGGAPELPEF